jgi:hypothetical protein
MYWAELIIKLNRRESEGLNSASVYRCLRVS